MTEGAFQLSSKDFGNKAEAARAYLDLVGVVQPASGLEQNWSRQSA
jgi:hypothetical protein